MNEVIKLPILLRIIRSFDFPKKLGVLERLYGRKLSSHGVCWVICANCVKWKLDLTDPCHRWIVFGKYEGGVGIDYAASQLKDGGVYIDSGANVGQWLLYLGSISGVKSFAFEPVISEREWLKECLIQYPQWETEIVDCGLGSERDTVEIQMQGSRSTLNMDWYVGKNLPKMEISLERLDAILAEKGIDQIDFWKLDVEGGELEALRGAREMLKRQKVACIYFECHPSNYERIVNLLGSYSYGVFDLKAKGVSPKTDSEIFSTEDLLALPLVKNSGVLEILCQFFNLQHNTMRRIDYDRQV